MKAFFGIIMGILFLAFGLTCTLAFVKLVFYLAWVWHPFKPLTCFIGY